MKNYLKNQLKNIPMTLLLFILFYSITTFSASSPLTAGEVTFDNDNTPLLADNVQGAVNEIFQHATDYNEIKTTIGTSTLTTTNQTLSGAVNELKTSIDNIITDVNGTKRSLIIKTGNLSIANGLNPETNNVTFSTPFPNGLVFVGTECMQEHFSAQSTISVWNESVSGFKISQNNSASATMTVRWIAIGY